jgi:hypothetical protein
MEHEIEVRRNNMICNMFDFLLDDCYVYLMTFAYSKFLENKEKGNSFYTQAMCLTNEFATRITKIYTDMKKEEPMKLVEEEYHNIVQKTIDTINSEANDFVVSFNMKGNVTYDVVFVRITPVEQQNTT